jgi:hypothetical protein
MQWRVNGLKELSGKMLSSRYYEDMDDFVWVKVDSEGQPDGRLAYYT